MKIMNTVKWDAKKDSATPVQIQLARNLYGSGGASNRIISILGSRVSLIRPTDPDADSDALT